MWAMLQLGDLLQGGLGAYLKKKALDPLDSYVTPLIKAKKELKSSGEVAGKAVRQHS